MIIFFFKDKLEFHKLWPKSSSSNCWKNSQNSLFSPSIYLNYIGPEQRRRDGNHPMIEWDSDTPTEFKITKRIWKSVSQLSKISEDMTLDMIELVLMNCCVYLFMFVYEWGILSAWGLILTELVCCLVLITIH